MTKRFGEIVALDEASIAVERGELFAVLGPSGCGKSTLLRVLMGFELPDSGQVSVNGRLLSGDGRSPVPPEKRQIGMVVQDYALFPHLSVLRNVEFGLHHLPRAERTGVARRALDLVGLTQREDAFAHELSGGERQRVALARALAPEPDVVLLDEPFSSLDASLRAGLRRDVQAILREVGTTAILVTHDQEEALSMADRVAVMREGRIVQTGEPQEIYWRPAERWVAEFVGDVNVLPGDVQSDTARTELGEIALLHQASDGKHAVAIRPEQLEVTADAEGGYEVVAREFYGHDIMYRVRTADGGTLVAQRPSVELCEVGDRVRIAPAPGSIASVIG
ncbi:MAG: ABC transporter ATP-binding protein [Thermoleophilaceae bacterium]|nr:ABC transporter ATP-binding protein [Thermoleophilaceae bacterium]